MKFLPHMDKHKRRPTAGGMADSAAATAAAFVSPPHRAEALTSVAASVALLRETTAAADVLRARLRGWLQQLGVDVGTPAAASAPDSIELDRFAVLLYLESGDFEAAMSHCLPNDQALLSVVLAAQAEHAFAHGEYERAARRFAQTAVPVEQLALKFVEARLPRPLATFLQTLLAQRVEAGEPSCASQRSLICTWLVQTYLAALADAGSRSGDADDGARASPAPLVPAPARPPPPL